MLSYPLPEAETLLISKLDTAQQSLANCEDDVDFLREQITVCFITKFRDLSFVFFFFFFEGGWIWY